MAVSDDPAAQNMAPSTKSGTQVTRARVLAHQKAPRLGTGQAPPSEAIFSGTSCESADPALKTTLRWRLHTAEVVRRALTSKSIQAEVATSVYSVMKMPLR